MSTIHFQVYLPMGDFMDLLSLINSAVNFLIYCVMNKKFRITFFELFCMCGHARKISRYLINLLLSLYTFTDFI